MLEKASSGEHLLGYNVLGSYALVRAKKDPGLGVVLPKDYTLVLSRVMFIGKSAKQPERGQALGRLRALAARPEDDRQRRRALRDARRRGRPSTRRRSSRSSWATNAEADPGERRDHRVRSTRRSASTSSRHWKQTLRREVSRERRRAARAPPRPESLPARAHDPRDGDGGARTAVAHPLPEPAHRAVLRRAQDGGPRRLPLRLRGRGLLAGVQELVPDRDRHDAHRRAARRRCSPS